MTVYINQDNDGNIIVTNANLAVFHKEITDYNEKPYYSKNFSWDDCWVAANDFKNIPNKMFKFGEAVSLWMFLGIINEESKYS